MFKYILVPATGADTDLPVFASALFIARLSDAHLEFLHVRLDVQKTLLAMAATDVGTGAGYDQALVSLGEEVASRQKSAELAFRAFCERERLPVSSNPSTGLPSAEFCTETGDELVCLATHGRAADLLVVGRAGEGEIIVRGVLEACLMATGRPVLIVPAKEPSNLSGTIAIAWKDRPEAARAVAAALPLIEAADRVIIFSVEEGEDAEEWSCEGLRHALSWHNSNIEVRRLKEVGRAPVETLLAAVSAAEANLLVMGAYGHSRLREVIFGGFTRRALSGADLPVFIAH